VIVFQEPFPFLWPAIFLIKKIYNIPIVVLIQADPVAPKIIKKLYQAIRKIIFAGTFCVTTSPNLLSKVESTSFLHKEVIPLGIPKVPQSNSQNLILPGRYVLYVGRLAGYKGIPYLLEAIKKLKNINFVIAGSGEAANEVRNFLDEDVGSHLTFIDRFITEDEKLELISRSDFIAFPSITENEAFGIVQLEAMRYGKPIVNTWLDSGVNFVAPDNICALTVNPCDSNALITAINTLWEDESLRKRLGSDGYERFINFFAEEKFKDSWTSLVQRIFHER
jgi:rhamnosyl/mannosyltransferase